MRIKFFGISLLILIFFFLFFFSNFIIAETKKEISSKSKIEEKESSRYLEQEINNIKNPQPIKSQGILGSIVNFILSLLFVIGLIYIMMLALKFFYIKASIPLTRQGAIKILAREFIEPKKSLYLVEFGGKILLLGVTDDNISKITEITDNETINKIKEDVDEFVLKAKLKNEKKFSEQLKKNYIIQTKNLVDKGNEIVKKIKEKFSKGNEK